MRKSDSDKNILQRFLVREILRELTDKTDSFCKTTNDAAENITAESKRAEVTWKK